jgi:hypothetical protein
MYLQACLELWQSVAQRGVGGSGQQKEDGCGAPCEDTAHPHRDRGATVVSAMQCLVFSRVSRRTR